MKDEDNFSNAKRGPVVKIPEGKTRITIRIDTDTLNWFREQVYKRGGGNCQTLLNEALREYVGSRKTDIERTLSKVIREELKALKQA
jgi:uncharacterized protein (DUF4415 family)